MPILSEDARDRDTLADVRAKVTSALSEAKGGGYGIRHPRFWFVTGQRDALSAVTRRGLADLVRANKAGIHPLLLLHLHIFAQRILPIFADHHNHTGGGETTITADDIVKVLENCEAFLCHTNGKFV